MLTVRDDRRGRSRSPGRERSNSRDHRDQSRDQRAKSPLPKDNKKSSNKNLDSDEDDRRFRKKKSSKPKYESDPDNDKRKHKKGSKPYSESENEESDGHHRKSTSKVYYDSDSEDTRRKSRHRHEPEDSDSDLRKEKSKKSSQKYYNPDPYEESARQRRSRSPDLPKDKSKEKDHHDENGIHPSYAQPRQYIYAQPSQYVQAAPAAPLPTRHMSFVDSRHVDPRQVDPRHEQWRQQWAEVSESERPGFVALPNAASPYSPPGAFPTVPHTHLPDHHRAHSISSPSGGHYTQPAQYQYAEIDPHIKYKSKSEKTYIQDPQQNYGVKPYTLTPYPQFVEEKPGTGKLERHEKKSRHEDPPSKKELASRLGSLAISGGAGLGAGLVVPTPSHGDGGRPPASPLLEAYHGTYQSISPMPSPMMLARSKHDDSDSTDLSDLDLSSKKSKATNKAGKTQERDTDISRNHRPSNASTTGPQIITATPRTPKRVSFYDPVPDATKIAAALAGTYHAPNTRRLISILPQLSAEDMLALRAEYKNHAKVSGKGINMAKHIKMRVPGNLGKAAYATALGRWESEAYWANSWYQSGGSRRELLIESLMGRSNSDIREIKACFRDKRYDDDLEKCMRAELKADKFRTAILLALQENRMSESSSTTPDPDLVGRDVDDLHRALRSRDGGETAMIHLIVLSSDAHLRAVLRAFEHAHRVNFAREMIAKSRNLVGETLAHILNGALNRPMRDALLLHQAIAETAPGKERAELLISRAVRLHWEPRHMEKVKRVYAERYGDSVGEALGTRVWAAMKTAEGREWVEFVARCLDVELVVVDPHSHGRRPSGGGGDRRPKDPGFDVQEVKPRHY